MERAAAWWEQASQIEAAAAAAAAALCLCHLLIRFIPDIQPLVLLTPGDVLTKPWQLGTANLFDTSMLSVLSTCAMLFISSAKLRERWSAREALRYFLIVAIGQAFASWCVMVVLYVLFREGHFLFARLGGCTGIVGGLAVALKQLQTLAESPPLLGGEVGGAASPATQLLMKHAPLLALGWSALLLAFTHAGPPDELLFSLHGVLVGWGYLRYYQPTEHGMGDSREAFEFAALFPPSLRPPIQVVGGACFGVVSNCCCGLFPPASALTHEALGKGARDGAHAGAHSTLHSTFHAALHSTMPPTGVAARAEAPLPSVTTEDPELAERRRQRARQLLDERLAAKGNAATPARDMPSAPTQV